MPLTAVERTEVMPGLRC